MSKFYVIETNDEVEEFKVKKQLVKMGIKYTGNDSVFDNRKYIRFTTDKKNLKKLKNRFNLKTNTIYFYIKK